MTLPATRKPLSLRRLWTIVTTLVGVVVIGGLVIWTVFLNEDVENADVGDCLNTRGQLVVSQDAKVVNCSASDAYTKVLGIIEGKTRDQWRAEEATICGGKWPAATRSIWTGHSDQPGTVFCLQPTGKK